MGRVLTFGAQAYHGIEPSKLNITLGKKFLPPTSRIERLLDLDHKNTFFHWIRITSGYLADIYARSLQIMNMVSNGYRQPKDRGPVKPGVLLTIIAVKKNMSRLSSSLSRQSEPLESDVITRGRQVEGSKSSNLNIKRNVTSFWTPGEWNGIYWFNQICIFKRSLWLLNGK